MATSNISFNGSFVDYDDKTDYQAKINQAVQKGDYTSAALYEAQRNAKLSSLGRGGEATSNYVSVYNGGKTNNQGGLIYEDKAKSVLDLPSNWTSARIGGAVYNKSGNNIYAQVGKFNDGSVNNRFVGSGVNAKTGEYTMDAASARKLYFDQMYSSGGGLKNYMDSDYVSALAKGTVGQYNQSLIDKTKAEEEAKKLAVLNTLDYDKDTKKRIDEMADDDFALVDDDNSFETDLDAYLKTKVRSFTSGY